MSPNDESTNSPIEGNIDDISYTDEEIEDWIIIVIPYNGILF